MIEITNSPSKKLKKKKKKGGDLIQFKQSFLSFYDLMAFLSLLYNIPISLYIKYIIKDITASIVLYYSFDFSSY